MTENPLHAFGTDIWLADGPTLNAMMGFHYPTRMAVIRLPDGGLLIWSPVAHSEALRQAVETLGPVTHLVAPNNLHHMFLSEWIAAYPDAKVHGAPGLAEKRPDIAFDTTLTLDTPICDGIDHVVIGGNKITTEVVFFHPASATVLVTDLLQNLPRDWFSGWRRWVARMDLMTEPQPTVPRKFRLGFRDRSLARAAIDRVLDWPCERVIIAHGTPIQSGGQAFLQNAFSWL